MNYLRQSQLGRPLCLAAEGGTSGKNSTTDQRQIQATSGGAYSPTIGGDGQINTGTTIENNGFGDTIIGDFGAIDRAFLFGENVLTQVGKVLVGQMATHAATVTANTDFLKSQTALLAANTEGGSAAAQSKTMLYVVLGVLALVGVIFFFRR